MYNGKKLLLLEKTYASDWTDASISFFYKGSVEKKTLSLFLILNLFSVTFPFYFFYFQF